MKRPRDIAQQLPSPFTAEELRQISAEISADWFCPDPVNYLTLLEIDPYNLHASWHVDPAAFAAGRLHWQQQWGTHDPQLVLRLYDQSPQTLGFSAHAPFDVAVHPASEQHYVSVWCDGRRFVAELGWRDEQGHFQMQLRSNEVALPRAGPSPDRGYHITELAIPAPLGVSTKLPVTPLLDHLIAPLMPPPLAVADLLAADLLAADLLAADNVAESTVRLSVPPLPLLHTDGVAPAGIHWLRQIVGAGGTAERVSDFLLPALGSSPVGGFPAWRKPAPGPERFTALAPDNCGGR